MGKQIDFKLKEINTKESINSKTDEDETVKSFKYTNDLAGIEIKVKGEQNADAMGMPTMTLDDSILVEFGPKQVQRKILDDDTELTVNDKRVETQEELESAMKDVFERQELSKKAKKARMGPIDSLDADEAKEKRKRGRPRK